MTTLLLIQQAIRQRRAKAASTSTAIERLSRRLEPKLRKRFLEAVKQAKAKVDLEALARAVLSGNLTQAELSIKLSEWPERFGELAIDMRAGFIAGSGLAYAAVNGASINLSFELVNPYAVTYAQRKLPQIVAMYQEGARQIIRDIVTESVGGKHTPQEAAKLIRESIGLTPRYEQAVRNLEARLLAEGISGERLETKVDKYRQKLLRSRSLTIARTEINQAAVAGQRALWNEAANQGLFDRQTATRVWRTSNEGFTNRGNPTPCPICAPLDGQVITFNGVYTHPEMGNVNVFREVLNGPPLHPSCYPGDTLVEGQIVGGLKAWYSGPIIELHTRKGYRLTITPNHPVLTEYGWISAGNLRKGDYVFSKGLRTIRTSIFRNVQDKHAPIMVQDVFQSLQSHGFTSGQVCALDLHGDALYVKGNVDIVGSDYSLKGWDVPARFKTEGDRFFERSYLNKFSGDSFSMLQFSGKRDGSSPASSPHFRQAFFNKGSVLLDEAPLRPLSVGHAAKWNVQGLQRSRYNHSMHSEFCRELLNRTTGQVSLDQLVSVRQYDFFGHVYDLQSVNGWILAHDIVISNCLCHEDLVF